MEKLYRIERLLADGSLKARIILWVYITLDQ